MWMPLACRTDMAPSIHSTHRTEGERAHLLQTTSVFTRSMQAAHRVLTIYLDDCWSDAQVDRAADRSSPAATCSIGAYGRPAVAKGQKDPAGAFARQSSRS